MTFLNLHEAKKHEIGNYHICIQFMSNFARIMWCLQLFPCLDDYTVGSLRSLCSGDDDTERSPLSLCSAGNNIKGSL